MTTTVVLANMPSTTATDVAVYFLDQTKLALQSSERSADGLQLAANYIYADGTIGEHFETTVAVRMNIDPRTGIVRNSIRLRTIQSVVVDSEPAKYDPIEVVLSWNTPGKPADIPALMQMIGTAYSLAFDGVTSKVPNTGILSEASRGLLGGLYG